MRSPASFSSTPPRSSDLGKVSAFCYPSRTEAEDRCKRALGQFANVEYLTHLSEIRDENDLQKSWHLLKCLIAYFTTSLSLMNEERATWSLLIQFIRQLARILAGEEFKWLSDNTLVQINLLPGVEKSTSDGGTILAHYTTEHVKSQWKTVLAFEKSSIDERCTVLCEHSGAKINYGRDIE
ncbi:hypothetical protein ACTXT7_002639 [Hymenolepis weldensis]